MLDSIHKVLIVMYLTHHTMSLVILILYWVMLCCVALKRSLGVDLKNIYEVMYIYLTGWLVLAVLLPLDTTSRYQYTGDQKPTIP